MTDAFTDLHAYVALPRVADLAPSPNGTRLATIRSTLDTERKKFVFALWEVDPRGERPARRLTRSAPGETRPAFLPSGDLLFTSKRPDPEVKDPDEEVAGLWLLPADGGEARQVGDRPGGVTALQVARNAGTVILTAPVPLAATSVNDDKERRKARKGCRRQRGAARVIRCATGITISVPMSSARTRPSRRRPTRDCMSRATRPRRPVERWTRAHN